MTDQPKTDAELLAEMAGQFLAGLPAATEAQMRLAMAEMEALMRLTPATPPRTDAERQEAEAAVEDGFDNMPV
jgi:hypothetical protein